MQRKAVILVAGIFFFTPCLKAGEIRTHKPKISANQKEKKKKKVVLITRVLRKRSKGQDRVLVPKAKEGAHGLGLRLRWISVPQFLVHTYLNKGEGLSNPGLGIEYTYRKTHYGMIFSVWWAGYMSNGANYLLEGDPYFDIEYIKSDLSALYLSGDFGLVHDFTSWLSFMYGLGIGMGFLMGDLSRSRTYQVEGEKVPTRRVCEAKGIPGGEEYPKKKRCQFVDKKESIFPVIPWIGLILALDIRPHPHFSLRLDGGVGVGFFLGTGISYVF
jgi:ribosomal protein S30